jgi:CYTH domain-containing protein/thymidylate kinase
VFVEISKKICKREIGVEITKIALAGGDCSGKSSAETFLRKELRKLGYYFVFVPEGATRIITQYGVNPGRMRRENPKQYRLFQKLIIETHLREEDLAIENALHFADSDKVVICYDRGVMDARAYMDEGDFTSLIHEMGYGVVALRDTRYDLVCHLVTAADGALAAYKKNVRNNPARKNRHPLDAITIDRQIKNAWLGHPHYRVIDNSTDVNGKLRSLLAVIKKELGIHEKIETERKFLVHRPPDKSGLPVPSVPIEIRQMYLLGKKRIRIRMRRQENEGAARYKTRKIPTAFAMSSVELESRIEPMRYRLLAQNKDPDRDEIRKIRHHFIHESQYFELDQFLSPARLKGLWLLEIELTNESDKVKIPAWLGSVTEVTNDKRYKNRQLAKKNP